MSDYGVTNTGVAIKRLDVLMDELHSDLSGGWGANTRLNPQSYLNVQLTAFADKVAELWEFGEQIYHAMYPFSAEGLSLDNAVQYGGVERENAKSTIYPIHCECTDGTIIPRGTLIKTSTNPAIQFLASRDTTVTRSALNRASVNVAVVQPSTIYTVVLDGNLYSYTSKATDTENDILDGLRSAITAQEFAVSVDSENKLLILQLADEQATSVMVLSGNLTTQTVTGIVNFESETAGEISLPNGVITQIVTSVPGLVSVINLLPYIAGRLRQNDIELRQSYAEKIFARSNRMLESIKSAILLNVQGVTSVVGYQNDTDTVDNNDRWPHCVEMVVEGGNEYEIALQIWTKKTDGIQTFGSTEVIVAGDEGEDVTIRFNRPEYAYVWFRVKITMNPAEALPPNYVDAIKEVIIAEMAKIEPGKQIIPQRLIEYPIYVSVPGIANIDTFVFYTVDKNQQPNQYNTGVVPITQRQRAITDATRIEVVLVG